MMKHISILSFLILFFNGFCHGQKTIKLKNPSFEGFHTYGGALEIEGWNDCSDLFFPNESAPDIHLSLELHEELTDSIFGVTEYASEGNTFLGMVVRENETFEAVGQKLTRKLEAGKCYSLSIDLSRSMDYKSPFPFSNKIHSKNFITPVVLYISGSSRSCAHDEYLAQSIPVTNSEWNTYNFVLRPTESYRYIMLAAYFDESLGKAYNGNLLLDNASMIIEIECPEKE